jgi:hypothetical protein
MSSLTDFFRKLWRFAWPLGILVALILAIILSTNSPFSIRRKSYVDAHTGRKRVVTTIAFIRIGDHVYDTRFRSAGCRIMSHTLPHNGYLKASTVDCGGGGVQVTAFLVCLRGRSG